MKIIRKNAVYVQKYYFKALLGSTLVTNVGVPITIFGVMGKPNFDKMNKKDFIKITNPKEVEFIKKADWIIDYDEYMNKGTDEICDEIKSIEESKSEICSWYHGLSSEDKERNCGWAISKDRMLRYRIESLKDMLLLKQRRRYNRLPGESILKRIFRTYNND